MWQVTGSFLSGGGAILAIHRTVPRSSLATTSWSPPSPSFPAAAATTFSPPSPASGHPGPEARAAMACPTHQNLNAPPHRLTTSGHRRAATDQLVWVSRAGRLICSRQRFAEKLPLSTTGERNVSIICNGCRELAHLRLRALVVGRLSLR